MATKEVILMPKMPITVNTSSTFSEMSISELRNCCNDGSTVCRS